MPRALLVLALAAAATAAVGACATADTTGGLGRRTGMPGEALWLDKCGACHDRPAPTHLDRQGWATAMVRHHRRVPLSAREWTELIDFLSAPAARDIVPAMTDHAALVEGFYRAFQARDPKGMAACYAPGVVFSDPVFPRLEGFRAGAMWQMLSERATDLALTYEGVRADERTGSARWTARYTFSKTGRAVVNVVDSAFEFEGGRIVRHTDRFDFWRWSRQALGPTGLLLGWSSLVRDKVRGEAARNLETFIRARGLGPAAP